MNGTETVCTSWSDIQACTGRRVVVRGEYVQLDVRQNPGSSAQLRAHAALRLRDGTTVTLEPAWTPQAIRGADERKRLTGKQVEAVGLLWAEAPEPPEPVASIVSPCLSPVESIDLVR